MPPRFDHGSHGQSQVWWFDDVLSVGVAWCKSATFSDIISKLMSWLILGVAMRSPACLALHGHKRGMEGRQLVE